MNVHSMSNRLLAIFPVDGATYLAAGTKMNPQTPIGMVETVTHSRDYATSVGFHHAD